MPSINLLPWRAELRQRRQKEFMMGLVGAVVMALLVALLAHFYISTRIDAQQRRNDLLRSEIVLLDKQIEEILVLEQEKARMIARMEVIKRLQHSRPEVVRLFDDIVSTLPEGVYLTSVKQQGRQLEFEGIAQSSTRVSAFMRNVDASDVLSRPDLRVIETGTAGAGSRFTMLAQLRAVETDEPAAEAGKPKRVQEASR